jgi:adenosylcobyric acid synthase
MARNDDTNMKKAKLIMIQGTASSVGKSIICAALCRIFKQDGYKVAPFKSQNMALNSFVTPEGGEIGRAQAVQAEAAGISPTVDMNPILLKPTSGSGCQVVVMGKVDRDISAGDYSVYAPSLLKTVMASLDRLRAEYNVVVIEGAGSTAEINLKDREIVNMRIAKASGSPVLLVGDIDKGGVYASLVGTLELLDEDERRYVKGFIINKFRGDVTLLQGANDFLEKRTSVPVLGVIPWFKDIRIAQEDSVYLDERPETKNGGNLDITVIRLPHIANFDDFDPLEMEGYNISYITQNFEMGNPHLIIIPGTKSTVYDMEYLRSTGIGKAIVEKARSGTPVIGICGGYQMLGKKILDPLKAESDKTEIDGLGLLNAVTEFAAEKSTRQVTAKCLSATGLLSGLQGMELTGYEIHMGQTSGKEAAAFQVTATPQNPTGYADGMVNSRGTVIGTYLHGLFYNDDFRHVFFNNLRRYWKLEESSQGNTFAKDTEYDKLADIVRQNLDMVKVHEIMEKGI